VALHKDLPPLLALRAFEAVARHLSFIKAAHELSVTQSALSHQVHKLEQYLGKPLFVRRTRAIDLTADGQHYYEQIRPALDLIAAATRSQRVVSSVTVLRIGLLASFATLWLAPRLAGFLVEDIKAGRVAVEDKVDRSVVTIRGDELFASASSSIVDDYQPLMLRIADASPQGQGPGARHRAQRQPPDCTLRFPSNWALSEARAKSVLEILAAKTGQGDRFSAEGRSDTEPVATNATAEGRARNRRVEITVLAEGVE